MSVGCVKSDIYEQVWPQENARRKRHLCTARRIGLHPAELLLKNDLAANHGERDPRLADFLRPRGKDVAREYR